MRLANKVALITGAARGMGRAIAERFGREGARLALFDLDEAEGNRVVQSLQAQGSEAIFVAGDVSSAADVERAVAKTVTAFGSLGLVVNSAGVRLIGRDLPVAEVDKKVWDRVIGVNLKGKYFVCKFAIPEMIRTCGGAITQIASIAFFKGWSMTGAYGASKGSVLILTKATRLPTPAIKSRPMQFSQVILTPQRPHPWPGTPPAGRHSSYAAQAAGSTRRGRECRRVPRVGVGIIRDWSRLHRGWRLDVRNSR